MNIRIGNGYDIHRLATERRLILGGVEISHSEGLLGLSDADDLTHAVYYLFQERGLKIGYIDSVVVAERPKLKPHIEKMREKLAGVLQIEPNQVGVKATTNEKLGPVGEEKGICAYAVVLLVVSG